MVNPISTQFAEVALKGKTSYSSKQFRGVVHKLFPQKHELLPQINQIYELDLAYGESQCLTDDELVEQGAYFRSVDGRLTNHFSICINTPGQVNATARPDRKNFFAANVFAVGYATHGLFPYRGKFHPQMIKAVLNIMGLKPGHIVLDPMAGCGTTAIEASVMGIDSIAYELSPFACLMTRAKVNALDLDTGQFPELLESASELYAGVSSMGEQGTSQLELVSTEVMSSSRDNVTLFSSLPKPLQQLILLCYLDSVGYARRRKGKTSRDLFPDLLSRYIDAVEAINESSERLDLCLGSSTIVEGDARHLDLPDDSIDGVLFSPPYSFAIDYLENDRHQLEFLGVDQEQLRAQMVGLIGAGRTKAELTRSRVERYFEDLRIIMRECERVLHDQSFCVIIVGSNTNQTGGVSLENALIDIGSEIGMPLEFQLRREIEGIRNTMRDEHLLFFRKP